MQHDNLLLFSPLLSKSQTPRVPENAEPQKFHTHTADFLRGSRLSNPSPSYFFSDQSQHHVSVRLARLARLDCVTVECLSKSKL